MSSTTILFLLPYIVTQTIHGTFNLKINVIIDGNSNLEKPCYPDGVMYSLLNDPRWHFGQVIKEDTGGFERSLLPTLSIEGSEPSRNHNYWLQVLSWCQWSTQIRSWILNAGRRTIQSTYIGELLRREICIGSEL